MQSLCIAPPTTPVALPANTHFAQGETNCKTGLNRGAKMLVREAPLLAIDRGREAVPGVGGQRVRPLLVPLAPRGGEDDADVRDRRPDRRDAAERHPARCRARRDRDAETTYLRRVARPEPLYVAFRERIDQARAVGEAALAREARTDWRAAAFLLERTAPERWARISHRTGEEPPAVDPFEEFAKPDELAARRRKR